MNNNMYLYFDSNGYLKEFITCPARAGSENVNSIYFYVEPALEPDRNKVDSNGDAYYALPNNLDHGVLTFKLHDVLDGVTDENGVALNSLAFTSANFRIEDIQPFNKKRDLLFFKWFQKYQFIKVDLTADILLTPGNVECTIGCYNALNTKVYNLDLFSFYVADSAVQSANYVTTSQYHMLLALMKSGLSSAVSRYDIDALDTLADIYNLIGTQISVLNIDDKEYLVEMSSSGSIVLYDLYNREWYAYEGSDNTAIDDVTRYLYRYHIATKEDLENFGNLFIHKGTASISAKELDTDVANCIAGNRPLITRQGGYLSKTDGTYKYANAHHSISSKMLDCQPGDIFYYKGYGVADAGSVLFYNGSTYVNYAIYNSPNAYTMVVIPSGINKVIFSSFAANGTDVVFDLIKANITLDMLSQEIKDILMVFTSQLGFLNKNNGNYSYAETYHSISSPLLSCKPGDTYYYKGIGSLATASVIFYNGSSIVSCLQIDSTNAYTPVIVPNGVNKVIFSSYAAIGTDVVFDLVKFNLAKNISSSNLAQKKYVACGDSFTKGGSLPDGSSYPYLVAKTKNMGLTLLAVNGGFIHYDISTYPNACFTNTSGSVNYTQIPADADYITIAYGLNESSVTIGDKTSTDHSTIWGAFNEVLGWIIANRPKAKVGIIANDSWFTYTMRNTLKEIAAYWGVGFLDLKEYGKTLLIGGKYSEDGAEISPTAVSARNTLFQVSSEDAHPNADGHKARATIIAEWLETL